jgi:hypothetical protein
MAEIQKIEIGNAVLYNGDCVEVTTLLDGFDHTICDPPYEAEAHSAARQVMGRDGLEAAELKFAAMDEETRAAITKLVIDKTTNWALFFCQVEANDFWRKAIEAADGKYFGTMAWVKPDAKPNYRGTGPGVGYENIVAGWCGEGKSSWNGGGRSGVFTHNKNEKKDDGNTHGTIKPQTLMIELVKLFTNTGQLIFDPFMGSGSTGVAAVSSGRKFIGIERDPEYFEICCRRIEKAQKETMFGGGYVKTKTRVVVDMFKGPETTTEVPKEAPVKLAKIPKPAKIAKATTKRAPKEKVAPVGRFAMPEIEDDEEERPVKVDRPRRPLQSPFAPFQSVLDEYGDIIRFDEDKWFDRTERAVVGCDVESYPNFFLINFTNLVTGERISFELSDRSNLDRESVKKIITRDRIVTFNGRNYDVPMIIKSLNDNVNTLELKQMTDRIIGESIKYWDAEREFGIRIPKNIDHIDLFEPNPAVRQSLKILMGRLHARMIMDLPFEPNRYLSPREMNIATMYCFNDIEGVKLLFDALKEPLELRRELSNQYGVDMRSKSDAQVGEAIIKARVKQITGRTPKNNGEPDTSAFSYEVPDFISFKNPELQAVLNDIRKATFWSGTGKIVLPKELEGRKVVIGGVTYKMGGGGLHSQEKYRAVHAVGNKRLRDVDVSSQYPLIILKVGVYPEAIGPVFLVVYKTLVDERLDSKEQARILIEETIPRLKTEGARDIEVVGGDEAFLKTLSELTERYTKEKVKAEGGKISANGVFGKSGSGYSVLHSTKLLLHTTLTGQLTILMLIAEAVEAGIPVMSANTDGVVFHYDVEQEDTLNAIVAEWEQKTTFKVEQAEYLSLYNQSVNSYIAIKPNGKVKLKGNHADPWSDNDLRGMMSKNPQMTVLTHAILAYIKNSTPFEETIRACKDVRTFVTINNVKGGGEWRGNKIGKVVRYYWSTDSDPIIYCTPDSRGTKKKVSNTSGARPLMDMTELPDDIDYDRYVAEANKLARELAVIDPPKGDLM